jgi:hypothetical protein
MANMATVNKRLDNLHRKVKPANNKANVIIWDDGLPLVEVVVCGKKEMMTLEEAKKRYGPIEKTIKWPEE